MHGTALFKWIPIFSVTFAEVGLRCLPAPARHALPQRFQRFRNLYGSLRRYSNLCPLQLLGLPWLSAILLGATMPIRYCYRHQHIQGSTLSLC